MLGLLIALIGTLLMFALFIWMVRRENKPVRELEKMRDQFASIVDYYYEEGQ